MAIALLTICDWGDSAERDTVVKNPSWSQIEMAIRNLNNDNLNDLYLQPDLQHAETFLGVGGGSGQYLVTGAIDNKSFPTLVHDDRPSDPKVPLIVGGQPSEYPANWISDLNSTLEAVRMFYDAGGFANNPKWVNV